jgi:hypothetical protein
LSVAALGNVKRFRQFYLAHPKGATLSHQLSWSHIVELLKIDDPLERGFYEQQTLREKWAVRELQRQKKSSLFLRLAAGKDKDAISARLAQTITGASPISTTPAALTARRNSSNDQEKFYFSRKMKLSTLPRRG